MLLLFDIDGTLVHAGAGEHAAALIAALSEAAGVDIPADAVRRVGPWGKTDSQIAREVLSVHGVSLDDLDPAWMERAVELYEAADLAGIATSAAPGAADALRAASDAGHRLALLTGNMEPIARRKLQAAGLGQWFEPGQGAFGSDAEDRNLLVPVALERAGGWPADRAVVIGDAPGDVACALAGGAFCVAVAGHFDEAALTGAHEVIGGLEGLIPALKRIAGSHFG